MEDSIFNRPDGTPLPANSCLEYRKDRGTYRMRVTIDRGPKFTGERIIIPLATSDKQTARMMRDAVLSALHKSGVLAREIIPLGDKIHDGDRKGQL